MPTYGRVPRYLTCLKVYIYITRAETTTTYRYIGTYNRYYIARSSADLSVGSK